MTTVKREKKATEDEADAATDAEEGVTKRQAPAKHSTLVKTTKTNQVSSDPSMPDLALLKKVFVTPFVTKPKLVIRKLLHVLGSLRTLSNRALKMKSKL